MLSAGELNTAVGTIEGVSYTGVLTRFVDSDAFEAGGKDCFYDRGPHEDGKRYTPKGGARGIYTAEGINVSARRSDSEWARRFKSKQSRHA